jgi:hypothetical protein
MQEDIWVCSAWTYVSGIAVKALRGRRGTRRRDADILPLPS